MSKSTHDRRLYSPLVASPWREGDRVALVELVMTSAYERWPPFPVLDDSSNLDGSLIAFGLNQEELKGLRANGIDADENTAVLIPRQLHGRIPRVSLIVILVPLIFLGPVAVTFGFMAMVGFIPNSRGRIPSEPWFRTPPGTQ